MPGRILREEAARAAPRRPRCKHVPPRTARPEERKMPRPCEWTASHRDACRPGVPRHEPHLRLRTPDRAEYGAARFARVRHHLPFQKRRCRLERRQPVSAPTRKRAPCLPFRPDRRQRDLHDEPGRQRPTRHHQRRQFGYRPSLVCRWHQARLHFQPNGEQRHLHDEPGRQRPGRPHEHPGLRIPARVVAGWDRDRLHAEEKGQRRDLRHQRRRDPPKEPHEKSRVRLGSSLVRRRSPHRLHVRSNRQPRGVRDGRRWERRDGPH